MTHAPRRLPIAAALSRAMIARMKPGTICTVAVVAAIALTACGGSAAPEHAHAVAKLSCSQQVTAWSKRAQPAFTAFNKAQTAVSRATDAEDLPAIRSGLERGGRAAAGMEAVPPPHCADPGGYYARWLDRYKAAGDNARSQGGVSGLEIAEAPLDGAPRLRKRLDAEMSKAGFDGP